MKQFDTSVFAQLRLDTTHAQIHEQFFPELNPSECEYPPKSTEENFQRYVRSRLAFREGMALLNAATKKLPPAYAEAFEALIYSELNERLEKFLELADKCVPESCGESACAAA